MESHGSSDRWVSSHGSRYGSVHGNDHGDDPPPAYGNHGSVASSVVNDDGSERRLQSPGPVTAPHPVARPGAPSQSRTPSQRTRSNSNPGSRPRARARSNPQQQQRPSSLLEWDPDCRYYVFSSKRLFCNLCRETRLCFCIMFWAFAIAISVAVAIGVTRKNG